MLQKIFLICFTISFTVVYAADKNDTEELIVVGSYLESKELNANPVDIISSEDYQKLNITNIAEISKYLNVSSGSHFQTNALDGVDQGMGSITLRGLDHASTLVLINTKRQTHAGTPSHEGEGYIDVNIIPEIALERVEILKDGATSLYGSDAVAGVINFHTFHDFKGFKFIGSRQETSSYDQNDNVLGFMLGTDFMGGDLVLAINILDRSPLSAREIPKLAEMGLSTLGNTFKVTKNDAIQSGPYAGSYLSGDWVKDPDCLENGGVISGPFCKFLYGERFNIVNDEDHKKGYFNYKTNTTFGDYSINLITALVDVNDNPQSPSYPALAYLSKEILPGQGGSPFNVPVIWYGRPLGSAFPSPKSPKDISQYHLSNVFNFAIDDDLNFELSLTASEHKNTHNRPDTVQSRFESAIQGNGGIDGNGQWNIFLPLTNSESLINYIKGQELSTKTGRLLSLDGIFTGTNNGINFAVGFQVNSEELEINYSQGSRATFNQAGQLVNFADLIFLGGGKNVDTSRNKRAIFFEANGDLNSGFDLTLAGRYESLKNESSFDPRLSLKYSLNDSLMFRSSIGTSFTSPSMGQAFSSEIQLGSVRDVDSSPFVRLALLGNPDLKPATSENLSLGFIWNVNDFIDLTIDYWSIDYENRIEVESAQVKLNENPNGPSITRNQFGDLIAVSTTYFNEEKTEVNGIDIKFNFYNSTSWGDIDFTIKGTQLREFLTPEHEDHEEGHAEEHIVMVNRVGKFNYDAHTHSLPKLRLNTFLSLERGDWAFGMNTRYIDGYTNNRLIPASALALGYTNKIKSFLVYDFSVSNSIQMRSGNLELSIAVINAFDDKAPLLYDAPDFSFDTRVHDPRGRLINLTVQYQY